MEESKELNLKDLEARLEKNQYLGGDFPSNEDREAYEKFKVHPPRDHVNLFAWYMIVGMFTEEVRKTWVEEQKKDNKAAGGKKGKDKGGKDKGGKGKKEEAPAKEEEEDDLFGDDLFGGGEEDEEAIKAMAEKSKKTAKAPPAGKSLVLFEVKVWEAEQDLDKLAAKILDEVTMEGLMWKTEYRKDPVAFGIYKLVMGCTIYDDIVSTEDIVSQITSFEDDVQSVDIAAFNKI